MVDNNELEINFCRFLIKIFNTNNNVSIKKNN